MTTEDLIALLSQHPRESIGVAVHCGEDVAYCAIDKVAARPGCRPRLLIHVEAELVLDEVSLASSVASAATLKGADGGSAL